LRVGQAWPAPTIRGVPTVLLADHGVTGWLATAAGIWLRLSVVALVCVAVVDAVRGRLARVPWHGVAWVSALLLVAMGLTPNLVFEDHDDATGMERGSCIGCGVVTIVATVAAVPLWRVINRHGAASS
jgi:hypothetical protein